MDFRRVLWHRCPSLILRVQEATLRRNIFWIFLLQISSENTAEVNRTFVGILRALMSKLHSTRRDETFGLNNKIWEINFSQTFRNLWWKVPDFWQKFFASVVKTILYVPSKRFCAQAFPSKWIISFLFLASFVESLRIYGPQFCCKIFETVLYLSSGTFWAKVFH